MLLLLISSEVLLLLKVRAAINGLEVTGMDDGQTVDRLLTPDETAKFLRLQVRTLEAMRQRGTGPGFIRYSGRCVRYRLRDLQLWLSAHEVRTEAAA